jgi:hypothetical protein
MLRLKKYHDEPAFAITAIRKTRVACTQKNGSQETVHPTPPTEVQPEAASGCSATKKRHWHVPSEFFAGQRDVQNVFEGKAGGLTRVVRLSEI